MPIYGRSALTEEEKQKLSQRLTYYIEEYLHNNRISSIEAANRLGIGPNKFSLLKNGGDHGRFLTSLDYLMGLAKLEDMELPDFMAFLLEKDLKKAKIANYSWNEKIYSSLEGLSIPLRKQFADEMILASEKDSELVELVARFGKLINNVDKAVLEKLVELGEHYLNKKQQ